ncbi:MAG: type II toxin-antitoxin system RelE/ParE family toxin [Hydrogenophilaceae bacterium]|nr:type II toxin-antitoxin system RelE/ParE family toxin [Hydrogenophilaceae bacterium]
MRLRIARSAEADLLNGHAFYERQQQGVGSYFLDSLYADIDSLLLYAGIHPKPYGHLYRMLAKRFPFAIYYDLQGNLVTVVAVLDCRQNPGSIKSRLQTR